MKAIACLEVQWDAVVAPPASVDHDGMAAFANRPFSDHPAVSEFDLCASLEFAVDIDGHLYVHIELVGY